jgi:hypothetical protein
MKCVKKNKNQERNVPSATLYTINPKWPRIAMSPGRRGGKPTTNYLGYGTAELEYTRTKLWWTILRRKTDICLEGLKDTKKLLSSTSRKQG